MNAVFLGPKPTIAEGEVDESFRSVYFSQLDFGYNFCIVIAVFGQEKMVGADAEGIVAVRQIFHVAFQGDLNALPYEGYPPLDSTLQEIDGRVTEYFSHLNGRRISVYRRGGA